MGRPVAVIAIGPDGVTVKPVVDVTKIGLAALTTVAALLGLVRTMRRGGKGASGSVVMRRAVRRMMAGGSGGGRGGA